MNEIIAGITSTSHMPPAIDCINAIAGKKANLDDAFITTRGRFSPHV
jgi:hypothetical protein